MQQPQVIQLKIFSPKEIVFQVNRWKLLSKTISFTNGCFDILHPGHIASLSEAALEADFLVVGLNSDASARRLKGTGRPVMDEQSRALMLASLLMVDAVVIFEEDTPLESYRNGKAGCVGKGRGLYDGSDRRGERSHCYRRKGRYQPDFAGFFNNRHHR